MRKPPLEAIAEGSPSEAWSALLDVMAARAAERTPADLMQQWSRDGFVQPAAIDQRTLNVLDAELLANASAFEAVELSPLAPLGACSVVGLGSQNRIVSALRGTEVVADPTNVLALECAARLHRDSSTVVRLATSHRCVRAQPYPKRPGFAPHFRIFCLATAGREQQGHGFLVAALVEHVETHLAALRRLGAAGYTFPPVSVRVLATAARAALGERVAAGIVSAPTSRGVLDHAYYDGLRFVIDVGELPMIDGGAFDWVGKLAGNRRLVFVASGFGSQMAAAMFRNSVRTESSDV